MEIKDIENITMDDIKPITISFKKNEEELVLYKWILGHSGYSGFVKDNLRKVMNKEDNKIISGMPQISKLKGLIDDD